MKAANIEPAPHLLLRADASPHIGTGHVMRCLALAQAWQAHGGRCTLYTEPGLPALEERFRNNGYEVEHHTFAPGSQADAIATAALAQQCGAAWIAADSYAFGAAFHSVARAAAPLLVVDDEALLPCYDADLVLNQNAGAEEPAYALRYGSRREDTRWLLGSRYALLRREFWAASAPAATANPEVQHIVVSLGGADPHNVTLRVLQALQGFPAHPRVTAVAGAANSHREVLQNWAKEAPFAVQIELDVPNMPALLASADLAVLAAGSTVWEACCLGLPFVTVVLAPNQQRTAQFLDEAEIAPCQGTFEALKTLELQAAVAALATDPQRRHEMGRRGRALIDGQGAHRVVRAMLSQLPLETSR